MVRYLPGFRSGNKIKMCVAIVYYMVSAAASFSTKDIGMFMGYIGFPIAIMNFSDYRVNKLNGYKFSSIIGLVVLLIGMTFSGEVRLEDEALDVGQVVASKGIVPNEVVSVEKELNKVKLTFENISEDQNKQAIDILSQCGINDIKEVAHDVDLDWEGLKGYRLSTELDNIGQVIAYFDHEKIRQVRFLGEYLYKSGEVVGLATDMFLTSSQQSDYQIKCKKVVESILKSPSTARFPNITKWEIGKVDGKVIVRSYVDSQNSFGAMLRSEFQFIIEEEKVISFIFDGQEMMK